MELKSCAIYSESKIFDNLSVDISNRSQNSKRMSANIPGNNGVYSPNKVESQRLKLRERERNLCSSGWRVQKISRSKH